MIIKQLLRSFLAGIAVGGMLLVIGCASTSPATYETSDDIADIDALLGLNETDNETIGEDDVLRLLGVMDESEEELGLASSEESGTDIDWSGTSSSNKEQPAGLNSVSGPSSETQSSQNLAFHEPESPSPSGATKVPSTKSGYEQSYDNARRSYNARDYRKALQQFNDLLTQDMNHSLSDNCQYWIGESHYGIGNYQQAIVAFEKVFTFPKSNKYADSQLKLGLSYMRLNNSSRAVEEFEKLVQNYPTSSYVTIARQYLDRMKTEQTP
ncbi:tetratricopeptide repeat protein [candidate division KSB1 bacterium]|nr:tetratricopeptide repeat protein [candidate division KSB1 bacterium]